MLTKNKQKIRHLYEKFITQLARECSTLSVTYRRERKKNYDCVHLTYKNNLNPISQ